MAKNHNRFPSASRNGGSTFQRGSSFGARVFCMQPMLVTVILALSCCQFTSAQEAFSGHRLAEAGVYQKAKTQFDGVLSEELVSYLKVNDNETLTLPVMSTGVVGERLDFTISMWLKVEEPSEISTGLQYIFAFNDSVACFYTISSSIMCDSVNRARLEVSPGSVQPGKWFNMFLSVSAEGPAYLLLRDNTRVIAIDEVADFPFVQNVPSRWSFCIGSCLGKIGFSGGVREVVARSSYIDLSTAAKSVNRVYSYSSDFKSYFRFNRDSERFNKDYFVDWTWVAFSGVADGQSLEAVMGVDFISNNMCLAQYQQDKFVRFEESTPMQTIDFQDYQLKQFDYDYTLSLQLYINDTTCTSYDSGSAENQGCHLLHLEGVFMLYFQHSNMARFRFFARKNYYETSSKILFLPNDEWLTIQLTMTHFRGYRISVFDQNGAILYTIQENRNMQQMLPKSRMTIGNSLHGSIGKFYLCESLNNIPMDPEQFQDCLFKLDLSENGLESFHVINKGRLGALNFAVEPNYQWLPSSIGVYGDELQRGTYLDDSQFDGIACDDQNLNIMFDGPQSGFCFVTPSKNESQSEMTIEFWIKPTDQSLYSDTKVLYKMVDEQTMKSYFLIYVRDGNLVCAPFGQNSIFGEEQSGDTQVVISDFSKEKIDNYGWWHISCGYQAGKKVKLSVSNQYYDLRASSSLANDTQIVPANSLSASVGHGLPGDIAIDKFLLKEVRLWSAYFEDDSHVNEFKHNQLDPTSFVNKVELLNYYRLLSGTVTALNLAQFQPDYPENVPAPQLNSARLVMDQTTKTDYVAADNENYVKVQVPAYHVVCPLSTYFKDYFCYSDPLNMMNMTVVPYFDQDTQELFWLFSILQSSAIDQQILSQLTQVWDASDPLLSYSLKANDSQNIMFRYIYSTLLRKEATYNVSVKVTNHQTTFVHQHQIQFVPNPCQWFEVEGVNAFAAKSTFNGEIGSQNFSFVLELKTLSSQECSEDAFYDKFDHLDFEFVLADGIEYIKEKPQPNVTVIQMQGSTSVPFKIEVSFPEEEQIKFPPNRDISIVMAVHWTSSQYSKLIDFSQLVSQHVIYAVRYIPPQGELVPSLRTNRNPVYAGESVTLDATSSFVSNLPVSEAKRGLEFVWSCPKNFEHLEQCQADSPTLEFIWDEVASSNITYNQSYDFNLTIRWVKDEQVIENRSLTQELSWHGPTIPEFQIDIYPDPVLVTSTEGTLFRVNQLNLVEEQFYDYEILWELQPPLQNQSAFKILQEDKLFAVESGAWALNTSYQITVSVQHKQFTNFLTTKDYQFRTTAPPNGQMEVLPHYAQIGDEITVKFFNWYTQNPPVTFEIFSTLDLEGSSINTKLNAQPITQEKNFTYVQDSNPVVVIATDELGETSEQYIRFHPLHPQENLTNSTENVNQTEEVAQSQSENQTSNATDSQDQNITEPDSAVVRLDQKLDSLGDKSISYQIEQRMILLQEIAADELSHEDSLSMFAQLESILANKAYNNLTTVNQALDIVESTEPTQSDFEFIQDYQDAQIKIMDKIFAIGGEDIMIVERINEQIQRLVDRLCELKMTDSRSGDLFGGYVLHRIGPDTTDFKNASVTGVSLSLNCRLMYEMLPGLQGEVCLQIKAIQGYSSQSSAVNVQIYNPATKERFTDFGHALTAKFDALPEQFRPGQTICHTEQGINEELATIGNECLTMVIVDELKVKCLCNVAKGQRILLMDDLSRPVGAPIQWPRKGGLSVFGELSLDGINLMFMSSFGVVALFGIIGSMLTLSLDRSDTKDQTQEMQSNQWQIDLVENIARQTEESIEVIQHRRHTLSSLMMNPNSGYFRLFFVHFHPMLAPFISTLPYESRTLRFGVYMINVQATAFLILYTFSSPNSDADHEKQISENQVGQVGLVMAIGSLMLLPWLLKLSKYLGKQIQAKSIVEPRKRTRTLVLAISQAGNFTLLGVSFWFGASMPSSCQYLAASALMGSIWLSSLVTNILYVMLLSTLAKTHRFKCLRPITADQLAQDLINVRMATRLPQTPRDCHIESKTLPNQRELVGQRIFTNQVTAKYQPSPSQTPEDEDQTKELKNQSDLCVSDYN